VGEANMKKQFLFAVIIFLSFILQSCSDEQVSSPVMDLTTGVYSTDIIVTISSATEGATIYYTTDGTTPTIESNVYSSPIAVAGNGTVIKINAIAVKHARYGITFESEIVSESYFINYGGSSSNSPSVISVTPTNNSTGIAVDGTITATFSVEMDPSTINTSTFTLQKGTIPITGTVDYSGTTATFTPDSDLEQHSTYIAMISTDAKDSSGSPLAGNYVWYFTTARNYEAWIDLGIIYETQDGSSAYYPSVIYDANGFGDGTPKYAMWYSDGAGATYLVTSSNGLQWSTPTTMVGIANSHHVQVLYDANCFGTPTCIDGVTTKYRIWFWDTGASTIYDISSMATAESADGINWINRAAVTQDPLALLIQEPDSGSGWNRGTYGPVFLVYQPDATNTGTEPWSYSYVMYYDGTDGGHEYTGLAYSANGSYWSAYTGNPVLSGSGTGGAQAWDCASAVYGTVFRDSIGFHYIYSGRGVDDGSGGCAFPSSFDGIGYASSVDGKTWIKSTGNPIFHTSDEGAYYRTNRIYTPSVVDDGSGVLKMYYSARGSADPKKIGLAVLH
jgi:hypothetical protein